MTNEVNNINSFIEELDVYIESEDIRQVRRQLELSVLKKETAISLFQFAYMVYILKQKVCFTIQKE